MDPPPAMGVILSSLWSYNAYLSPCASPRRRFVPILRSLMLSSVITHHVINLVRMHPLSGLRMNKDSMKERCWYERSPNFARCKPSRLQQPKIAPGQKLLRTGFHQTSSFGRPTIKHQTPIGNPCEIYTMICELAATRSRQNPVKDFWLSEPRRKHKICSCTVLYNTNFMSNRHS